MHLRVLILILIAGFISPLYVHASEPDKAWNTKLIYPEGHNLESEDYFTIQATPGELLEMNLAIHNKGDEPLKLLVEKTNSFTAPEGGILYGEEFFSEESALLEEAVLMTDLMKVDDQLTIPAGGAEELHVHLKVPEEAEGTLLGGIKLVRSDAGAEVLSEMVNEGGTNYYYQDDQQQSIAIQINLPGEALPNFSIGKADFNAANHSVYFEAVNDSKTIQKNIKAAYTVMNQEEEKIFSGVIEEFAMAPMSEIKFPVQWSQEKIEDGTYTLMIKGSAGEKEFFTEETFTVSEDSNTVMALSNTDVSQPNSQSGNLFWGWLAGAAVVIIPVLFFIRKRKYYMNKFGNLL